MNDSEIYNKLYEIFSSHRKRYKHNPKSLQMWDMWSTTNPPDVLECTKPIEDLERTFNIVLDEDDAVELYDMDLTEASKRLEKLIHEQQE